MAERDYAYYHLLDFEKKVKQLKIEFFYAKKENRKVALLVSDHLALLKQYANEAYNICCDNKIDPTYKKIAQEAKNLVEGNDVSFDFKKIRGTKLEIAQYPGYVEMETYAYMLRFIKKFNSLVNLSDDGACLICYHYKIKRFKLEKESLYGKELSWNVEIAFFILMKLNEIMNNCGFELVM